jgi:CheY-specific phosphatase CheX
MQLDNEDIRNLTESIWESTLGLSLAAVSGPSRLEGREFLTGCVSIRGAWQGFTALRCSLPLARKAAAIMFDQSEPGLDEVKDALGELVNMTGGNIKPLLPAPCELSLPSIIEDKDHQLTAAGAELLTRLFFEYDGEPVEVLLLQGPQGGARQPAA